MVQWLGLHAFTAKGTGSVPGQETKIPQAVWCSQKKKKYNKVFEYCASHCEYPLLGGLLKLPILRVPAMWPDVEDSGRI